ncbi:IS630 family transposase [Streptomyces sp. NPDC056669]|uniref:IS630 family transposase n=1 Tax=Streptomyces sp. NPDC056669 TaxID=3345903 RepID=UPI00368B8117
MVPGTPERQSFDYVRHGTIDLFAALNTATGKVIGKLSAQHRAVDFRDFLDKIDRQTDPGLAVHVICDNLSAHKAPVVHPRFQPHFTSTYSSWINQVERWFAGLERRCLERGVCCSLDELKAPLEDWIKIWNEEARPFKWTKTRAPHLVPGAGLFVVVGCAAPLREQIACDHGRRRVFRPVERECPAPREMQGQGARSRQVKNRQVGAARTA